MFTAIAYPKQAPAQLRLKKCAHRRAATCGSTSPARKFNAPRCLRSFALCLVLASLSALPAVVTAQIPSSLPRDTATKSTSDSRQLAHLQDLKRRLAEDPRDYVSETTLIKLTMRKSRETGNVSEIPRAAKRLEAILDELGNYEPAVAPLCSAYLALHEFGKATALARQSLLGNPSDPELLTTLFDAEFEQGNLTAAREALSRLQKGYGDLPSTLTRASRSAVFEGKEKEAEKLLTRASAEAAASVSMSKMDQAWYRLALGQFLFTQGRFKESLAQYQLAEETFPGWWATHTHFGELYAAERNYTEALSHLEEAYAGSLRPEVAQAIGEVYALAKQPAKAAEWLSKAEQAYLRAEQDGLTLFLHHQASFYSDAAPNPARALALAERDLALRTTQNTLDQLAWAHYRAGNLELALDSIKRALQSGNPSPHVLYHASMIFGALGSLQESKRLLTAASAKNPKFLEFHFHH